MQCALYVFALGCTIDRFVNDDDEYDDDDYDAGERMTHRFFVWCTYEAESINISPEVSRAT